MSDRDDPYGPARPDAATRIRRAGAALAAQLRALLVPDRGVPPLVGAGRARLAVAIAVAAALLAAAAISARIDLAPAVRAEAAGGPPPGAGPGPGPGGPPGEDRTDSDIEEEISKRTAIVQVKAWLDAGLGTPGRIFGLALLLLLLGRYVGGKPTFQRSLAAASVAALPWAVRSLIEAAAAWRQDSIAADDLGHLVVAGLPVATDNPLFARLFASADLFSLWSVVLCIFGLAAAAGISRRRAFAAVTVGYLLLVLLRTSLGAP